jgi:predicted AAA+ superfamily ATPase
MQALKRRLAAQLVRTRLADYPAVAVFGPRQSGKTTLARTLSRTYFDAEQPEERVRLDLSWDELVSGRKLVVIDEAQAWPEIFPRLRAAIDKRRRQKGRFLLLGSVSPSLMHQVSESLAGRLGIVELSPFLVSELGRGAEGKLWLRGGFPDGGVLAERAFPGWQRDYLALLTQRDLPAWGLAARPQATQRLIAMLAATHAQFWNASRIAQSLGVSYHTVNSQLDYLEGAYLVRRLAPWSKNVSKRLVKSPKVYVRDSGILHSLMGVSNRTDLLRHPAVGASWEGFVVEQTLSHLAARGVHATPFCFRTSDGYEIDLLLELGSKRVAIEVKLSSRPTPDDMFRLDKAAALAGATHRFLVCQTREPKAAPTHGVLDVSSLLHRLEAMVQ